MILVVGDVLEADLYRIGRHSPARSIGPFDKDDRGTVDNVVPCKVREIVWTSQTVKVQMKYSCALRMIFVHERECRTGHIFTNSNTAADRLRERRLAGAEVAFERYDGWHPESPTQVLSPRA